MCIKQHLVVLQTPLMVFDITMVENEKPTRFVHDSVSTNATMAVDRGASAILQNLTGRLAQENTFQLEKALFPS